MGTPLEGNGNCMMQTCMGGELNVGHLVLFHNPVMA